MYHKGLSLKKVGFPHYLVPRGFGLDFAGGGLKLCMFPSDAQGFHGFSEVFLGVNPMVVFNRFFVLGNKDLLVFLI